MRWIPCTWVHEQMALRTDGVKPSSISASSSGSRWKGDFALRAIRFLPRCFGVAVIIEKPFQKVAKGKETP